MNRSQRVDPAITTVIVRESNGLVVRGTARLPDGTRLRCGLWRGGIEGPFADIVYGWTDVEDGLFEWVADGARWSGQVSASVELRADGSQPEATKRVIGKVGEHLAYSDTEGPSYRQVFVVATASCT
jgi:hypothetical protein